MGTAASWGLALCAPLAAHEPPAGGSSSGENDDTAAAAEREAELLSGIRQLTFAGRRAGEGYFSPDGAKMIFQSERDAENPFFQMYVVDLESGDTVRISPGHGKTTCGWIFPSGREAIFASTHDDPEARRKQKDELEFRASGQERRYAWDYDRTYEIYRTDIDGDGPWTNLTQTEGYDAEGAVSPDGQWIVFASNREAYEEGYPDDLREKFEIDPAHAMEIYRMRADGSGVERLTDSAGYDGGPFFSADGAKICWRRFSEDGARAEIFVMNADGSEQTQITQLGAMSWAPFFHPSGDYLVFATNVPGFGNFELYLIDAAGEREPVRVTGTDGFDGLASFSPHGSTLTWTSSRTPDGKSQIFIGDWDDAAARTLLGIDGSAVRDALAGETLPDTAPDIAATDAEIRGDDLARHVEFLASEELEGRLTGTEGERLATAYAANAFAAFGLEPAGDKGSYFQSFEFVAGVDLGDGNALAARAGEKSLSFAPSEDWIPLSFSETGNLGPAGVVFAGYGIEAPEETAADGATHPFYSSYVHLDVEGKWVMVFRYMPEDVEPAARQRLARYTSLRHKAMVARQKGALGLIVVSGPNAQVKDQLVPLGFDASLAGSGIGAISVTDETAAALLNAAGVAKSLEELQTARDSGEMESGIPLPDVELAATIAIDHERRTGRSVVARLRAKSKDASSRAAVVLGAHIDHLGREGGAGSRATGDALSEIHFGADDNASGVAALLEIAQKFKADQEAGKLALARDVIFGAWSGEELGLLGSNRFVAVAAEAGDPHASLQDQFVACLNMDMIGRLDRALILQGVGSSSYWPGEIEKRNVVVGLPLVLQNESYLPTDATSFYLKGIPILSAFTGAHEDYHTPADTVDKINYEGLEKVTRLMSLLARGLAVSDAVPDYKAMEKPKDSGSRGGLRAYLGTIPDYAQSDVSGVALSGVAEHGPAAEAGIRAGDIIVSLAGQEVKNIYDYTFVIGTLKIGETVPVTIRRDGADVNLEITPESRD